MEYQGSWFLATYKHNTIFNVGGLIKMPFVYVYKNRKIQNTKRMNEIRRTISKINRLQHRTFELRITRSALRTALCASY